MLEVGVKGPERGEEGPEEPEPIDDEGEII